MSQAEQSFYSRHYDVSLVSGLTAFRPLFRRQGFYRQRMNLLLHPVAECTVNKLMLLHPILPAKLSAYNDGIEMPAILALHMNQFAWHRGLNVASYAF